MRQSEALEILESGASAFVTGAPGAGKTYVLNAFVEHMRGQGVNVAVTASTGIASTHINGQTIHSWSGIGVADTLSDTLLKTIRSRRRNKLRSADVLVIDEVSMMHAWLFDMVDRVCRFVRRRPEPFGGLQVVLSGDFFQLPPVDVSQRRAKEITPGPEYVAMRERYARVGKDPEGFVTQSLVWEELDPVIAYGKCRNGERQALGGHHGSSRRQAARGQGRTALLGSDAGADGRVRRLPQRYGHALRGLLVLRHGQFPHRPQACGPLRAPSNIDHGVVQVLRRLLALSV